MNISLFILLSAGFQNVPEISFFNFLQLMSLALNLTARQYGEVVLPDEAPVTCPGSLASNFSRCKAGMARVFAVMA
jgi:hypothetical protein